MVIDSPPLQAVTDAAILASIADGTVFIVDAGRTRRGAVRSGREALAKAGAHVLGVVLNRLPERSSDSYSYYEYYGADGASGGGQSGGSTAKTQAAGKQG